MTKKSYFSLVEALLEGNITTFDFETTSDAQGKNKNFEYWHPHSRIVSGSFTVRDAGTWIIPCSHPEGPWGERWRLILTNLARAILKNKNMKLVGHNIKYDLNWWYAMTQVPLETRCWWDTSMSDYILDENESHKLEDKAERDLGVEGWGINVKNPEKQSWDILGPYNARDTHYTDLVQRKDYERLLREPRLARLFHFLGMPIIRRLILIEREGMPINLPIVERRKKEATKIVERETEYLLKIAQDKLGMDLEDYPTISFGGSTSKFFAAFMERSGLPVVSYTPQGAPSWTEDNLKQLDRQGHKLVKHIMEVRKNSNKLSKFFVPWTEKVAQDKKLHPTFNPMIVDDKWGDKKGTLTGRLSGNNPNPQQIARDEKGCFGGVEGWRVAEIDYSQIELRMIAWIAPEPSMMQAFIDEEDLHTILAAEITGKDPKDITGIERTGAKAGNFGFAYLMQEQGFIDYAFKTYNGLVITLEEAKIIRRAFFSKWSKLADWHERQINFAHRYGFVRNPFGRRRRLPELYSGNEYEIRRAERKAVNAPIQSAASDLMSLALIEIGRQTDPREVRLFGTVHDSLLALVREDTWEHNLRDIARIMLRPNTERRFGVKVEVPLAVEAKVGYYWDDPNGVTRVFTDSTID